MTNGEWGKRLSGSFALPRGCLGAEAAYDEDGAFVGAVLVDAWALLCNAVGVFASRAPFERLGVSTHRQAQREDSGRLRSRLG
jgi:hypothetical protein